MYFSKIRFFVFVLHVVAFISLRLWLSEPGDPVPIPTASPSRFVKINNVSVDNTLSIVESKESLRFFIDLKAANTYIERLGGQPISSEDIHIHLEQKPQWMKWFVSIAYAAPRTGLHMYFEESDIKGIKSQLDTMFRWYIYHELYHWAVATQPRPAYYFSIFYYSAWSLWIMPTVFLFYLDPRLVQSLKSARSPNIVRYVLRGIAYIYCVFAIPYYVQPEEIMASYQAVQAVHAGAPQVLTYKAVHEYDQSWSPETDQYGNLRESELVFPPLAEQYPLIWIAGSSMQSVLRTTLALGAFCWLGLLFSHKDERTLRLRALAFPLWIGGLTYYNSATAISVFDALTTSILRDHYTLRAFSYQWFNEPKLQPKLEQRYSPPSAAEQRQREIQKMKLADGQFLFCGLLLKNYQKRTGVVMVNVINFSQRETVTKITMKIVPCGNNKPTMAFTNKNASNNLIRTPAGQIVTKFYEVRLLKMPADLTTIDLVGTQFGKQKTGHMELRF